MNRTPVESSQIKSIGYEHGILEVEFKGGGGGVYQYSNVTPETFNALMGKDAQGQPLKTDKPHSVGSYFIHNIKKRPDLYPYKKIEQAAK